MEKKTMMEYALEMQESEYYSRFKYELRILLDFVERWNKQDKELDAARATQYISNIINNK